MANENSVRSYRDFDAYNRDAYASDTASRQGQGDPLADLARIMGQDDTYAELLKSVARTKGEPLAPVDADDDRHAHLDEPLDIPAMALRGSAPAAAANIDWDDLEAELQTYQQSEAHHDDAAADEHTSDADLRGSYDEWDRGGASTAELERLLSDEFRRPSADVAEDGDHDGRSGLAYGAAAGAAVGGAAALAWRARASRQPDASAHPQSYGDDADPRYDAQADSAVPHDAAIYDEAPPRRRRAGMTAVAAVLGLAVLGGGGVFAYRSVTGGSANGGEPRVVRANPEPVRVAAQQAQDPKPVTDRVAGGDRVVPREERPVSTREQAAQVQAPPAPSRVIPLVPAPTPPAGSVTDPGQPIVRTVNAVPVPMAPAAAPAMRPQTTASQAAVSAPTMRPGEEPRRVRTVQVGPDGSFMAPQPAARPAPQPAPAAQNNALSVVPAAPQPALAAAESRSTPAPAPRPVQPVRVARAESAAEPRPAPPRAAGSTPLDLGPQRTASVRTAATASGSTFVQISSHQSEAEARSAFAAAQRRYPQLQGQSANIRTAEIAGRGTWHRLRVGPFSRDEAQNFCQRLKSAGGSCVLN